jgi:hypothetical protein
MTDFLKSPFGFLLVRSQKEKLMAEYVMREHARGRTLDDILDDAYVTNRLSPEQVSRLLERPEIVQAVGNDIVVARRPSA